MSNNVAIESERQFKPVEWGRTKNIFGPGNVGAEHVQINVTEYAPGTEHKMHKHPDEEEIIYVLDGQGVSRTKAGDSPIAPGSFVFIGKNVEHATINLLKDRPMRAIVIKAPPPKAKL